MLRIACKDFEVFRYDITEGIPENEKTASSKYVIVRTNSSDIQRIEQLRSLGYRFHDRTLRIKIDLKQTEEMRKQVSEKLLNVPVAIRNELTEEMYKLACETYTVDRRFHLDQQFDQELSAKVLEGYFNDFRNKNIRIYEAEVQGELLGFTVQEITDQGYGENILGVTKQNMKGKMMAWGLYQTMLEKMREPEAGNCNHYFGNVSSTNLASINLHIKLGGTVDSIYDEYIRKFD